MGNNTNNIVEINGKRYDAITGALLDDSPVSHPATMHPAYRPKSGSNLDGIARSQKPHTPASHVRHHTPQHSKTLMRTAVKKPDIQSPEVIKARTRTDLLATVSKQTVAPKISYNAVNKLRHKRAERMVKHPAVSRYGDITRVPVRSAHAVLPLETPAHTSHHPQPPSHQAPPEPPVVEQRAQHHKPDIFEQALAMATSHEQTYKPEPRSRRRARALGLIGASAAILLLVGIISYLNSTNISLAVASYRSGVDARLPSAELEGFDVGSFDYQPGNVVINYTSPEDSRQFNISQKTSSWDSQALLSNFVASVGDNYKTYQKAGRTVYLLGDNVATWVDSGVWYTVDGNSSLDSRQVLELATSM